MMYGRGKSDLAIVVTKPTNKAGQPVAEPVEQRAGAEGTAGRQSTLRAQNRERVTQALDRVRQAARKTEEGTVHHAPPPYQRRSAAVGVLRPQARRRGRSRRPDLARLRAGPRA